MKIKVHNSAEMDIERIWDADEESAATIVTLIEEMDNNPELAETLIRHGYRDLNDPAYEISEFKELYHKGYNIYRMKFWGYEGESISYRIIYAFDPRDDIIYVLAVVDRKGFNYEKTDPIVQRIIRDYKELGISIY